MISSRPPGFSTRNASFIVWMRSGKCSMISQARISERFLCPWPLAAEIHKLIGRFADIDVDEARLQAIRTAQVQAQRWQCPLSTARKRRWIAERDMPKYAQMLPATCTAASVKAKSTANFTWRIGVAHGRKSSAWFFSLGSPRFEISKHCFVCCLLSVDEDHVKSIRRLQTTRVFCESLLPKIWNPPRM